MKNLKTYEAFFRDALYNDNDYVIIKDSKGENHISKIIRYSKIAESYLLYVYDFNGERWMGYNRVIRKLTPEEKIDFEMKLNSKKFNL